MKLNTAKAFALMLLTTVGCSGSEGGPASSEAGPDKGISVGLVFDSGGRGDKSFNDSADRGVERAKSELGVEVKTVDSRSANDYVPNLTALGEQGVDLIIAVGINMQNAVQEVAPNFPEVKFAIVDAMVDQPNVRSLLFKEEEGSFLAGYLAGLMTESNKIGFVGGEEIDLIRKFLYGFEAGAKTANPNVEVLPAKYTGNWDDTSKAKQAANVLYSGGADIVYHAAGKAGLGVFAAAEDSGKYAIGVDSDQDYLEEGRILTSMVKGVDTSVFETIKDVQDGKFSSGAKVYDLKAGGVGLSEMQFTKDLIGPEKLAKVDEMKQKIVSGEIKAPATREELDAYLASL